MKKNDFWILTLIVVFGWNIWLKIIVIANSILVLLQVIYQIYKRRKHNG